MYDKESFKRCINGHIVPHDATYCPWCGEIMSKKQQVNKDNSKTNTILLDGEGQHERHTIKIEDISNNNEKTIVFNKSRKNDTSIGKLVAFLVTYEIIPNGSYFPIREGREIIGRSASATIKIDDAQLSKEHAVILYRNNKFIFEDLLSTNGSYINGHDVIGRKELHHSDIIEMGNHKFIFVEIPNRNINNIKK